MLGKSLKATMKEITELENMRESLKTSIREVQSNMLKGSALHDLLVSELFIFGLFSENEEGGDYSV